MSLKFFAIADFYFSDALPSRNFSFFFLDGLPSWTLREVNSCNILYLSMEEFFLSFFLSF